MRAATILITRVFRYQSKAFKFIMNIYDKIAIFKCLQLINSIRSLQIFQNVYWLYFWRLCFKNYIYIYIYFFNVVRKMVTIHEVFKNYKIFPVQELKRLYQIFHFKNFNKKYYSYKLRYSATIKKQINILNIKNTFST